MGVSNRMHFNLYATPPHNCSYLVNRLATTVFIDPCYPKDVHLYTTLSQRGFRRSGEHLYRPQCGGCQKCIAVRVPVNRFQPRRQQKRVWKKNADLKFIPQIPTFQTEHFELYQRYLVSRHRGGGMDDPTPESYMKFLTSSWSNSMFYEVRLDDKLLGIAVADLFKNGMSAVYTFFDPDYSERSLGVFAILAEIEECKRLNLDYLYLGYWVEECRKMNYKNNYQPLEYYWKGKWIENFQV